MCGTSLNAEPEIMSRIAEILGGETAERALFVLGKRVGAEMALKNLGLREDDLDEAADIAVQNPYWNPRPIERDGIRQLLRQAWAGEAPG